MEKLSLLFHIYFRKRIIAALSLEINCMPACGVWANFLSELEIYMYAVDNHNFSRIS